MINVLLDPLPDIWEGSDGKVYQLDTSFRIGIQICLIQTDPELNATDKSILIRKLLFIEDAPNGQDLNDCVEFFLSGWDHDNPSSKKSHKRLMDFDVDQWRIYSAFRQQYGINLNTAGLHWWEFMGMLSSLQECSYTRVVGIRQKEFKPKMDKDERKALAEAKEVYELDNQLSPEDKMINDNLFDFLGGMKSQQEQKRIEEFEKFADVNKE
jgi:hypothetical protein